MAGQSDYIGAELISRFIAGNTAVFKDKNRFHICLIKLL